MNPLSIHLAEIASNPTLIATILILTLINTLSSSVVYFIGRLFKMDWINQHIKFDSKKLEKYLEKARRYGPLLALFAWIPGGNAICLALGIARTRKGATLIMFLLGKLLRNVVVACTVGLVLPISVIKK